MTWNNVEVSHTSLNGSCMLKSGDLWAPNGILDSPPQDIMEVVASSQDDLNLSKSSESISDVASECIESKKRKREGDEHFIEEKKPKLNVMVLLTASEKDEQINRLAEEVCFLKEK